MIDTLPSLLLPFAATCLLIELTPGPNMGYLAIVSATKGHKAGFAATAGVALGLLLIGCAAALGLAAVISNSPLLFQGLRWVGVFYLLWLAWEGWNESASAPVGAVHEKISTAKYFRRGLITNLLNPKAGVFYVAILPRFTDVGSNVTVQLGVLTFVYVAIATAIHLTIVILAGSAQRFLDDPWWSQMIRRALSLALAAIAIWFGWSTGN